MGRDNTLESLEGLVDSIDEINKHIAKIDWNKKFGSDYSETKSSTEAIKNFQKSEAKDSLKEIFDESSLVLSGLKRASE